MSFGILRTNVGLTTNIKIMVESNDRLSLDSIESDDKLSLSRFKKFRFNKSSLYDELIPIYYRDIPNETSFFIKNNDLNNKEFSNQFDNFYNYGARNIISNKDYIEDYEYFAPLYIDGDIPNNFIIFRVDGPGIELLTRENFKDNIINKLKVVKLFDLTTNSNLGQWLTLNFIDNEFFPKSPLEIDFRNLEFSRWNGIDYKFGGYTSKSLFMDDIFQNEKEIFQLEKFIFNNFKENNIVFPNIINLSFLFNDKPSNPEIDKKWSLNRYYGFYLDDLEQKYSISPYTPPKLRDDVVILENNLIYSESNPNNPFLEDWSNNKPFYVEYKGEYYLVQRYTETRGDKIMKIPDDGFISEDYQTIVLNFYTIISPIDLEGKHGELNKNYGYIDNDNLIFDDEDTLSDFDSGDIWIIEIDGIFHKLIKQDDDIKINSDYEFIFKESSYEYKVGSNSTIIDIKVDFDNPPKKFNIYRCKFSDIKDFDTRIVDTEYSKFEYEKRDELTITDETKMYLDDLSSNTNPKSTDDFIFNNRVTNIPVSSEYTANFETFKVEQDQNLSDIWKVNPVYCRWVFKNSLSNNDYPYPLNNSNVFEIFNRTTNTYLADPDRSERNLDYFYTINSSTSSYIHHSLHIEKNINGEIDTNFKFDKDKYLNIDYQYDYFTSFFESRSEFDKSNIKKNTKKYSIFNSGDESIPNITLFRGIEFRIYNTESIIIDNNIESINLSNSNEFDNYKFSILLTNSDSNIEWEILDEWKMNKEYLSGDTIIFEDILYTAIDDNITDNPVTSLGAKTAPYNLSSWTYSTELSLGISQSIFWSPNKVYDKYDYVYNSGDYYYVSMTSSNIDFWNPIIAQENGGYSTSSVVLFKGNYYQSMTASNIYPPDFMINKTSYREFQSFSTNVLDSEQIGIKSVPKYWKLIEKPDNTKWEKIEIWNPSTIYNITPGDSKLVYHNDIIWLSSASLDMGVEPINDSVWQRKYSIIPDNNFIYNVNNNSIIYLNNRFYLIKSNVDNETLNNGITVYINKKWKNILINIDFSDNTLPNLSNSDRDELYDDIYKNLTAFNFINSINEFYNINGFSYHLKYVIIDEDLNKTEYSFDNNIQSVPYLLQAYPPDSINVNFSSLSKFGSSLKINLKKVLKNGNIDDISKLNWYNNIPISYRITENNFLEKPIINYSGFRNTSVNIFRFSGKYTPLFYDIQLFDKNTEFRLTGNYKFDTSLTEFGLIKELKIRKINRNGDILNSDNNIYPMVDEFDYNFTDFMIFKSNFDLNYHIETLSKDNISLNPLENDEIVEVPITIGQSSITKNQNLKNYNL